MSQKKRSDKNSVTAALGGFKGAIESVPLPQGVELRSDEEMVISIYAEAVEALKVGDAYYAGRKFKEAESLLPQSEWAAKASLMESYSHYSRNAYSNWTYSL